MSDHATTQDLAAHGEATPVQVHRAPIVVYEGPQDLKGVAAFGKVFGWVMGGALLLFVFMIARFSINSKDSIALYEQEKADAAAAAAEAPAAPAAKPAEPAAPGTAPMPGQ